MRPHPLLAPLLALALCAAPAPASATDAPSALSALSVTGGKITDAGGRTVLLRGVNDNQLNDYAANDPDLPTVTPLTDADFAGMAALGFDVVRLNVAWSALEPTRGAFDLAYVAKIRQAVQDAAAHGMYTVLDMHQDAWGKAVGTPAGTTCPPGLDANEGWDGAPAWATLTNGLTTCDIAGVREISPAVATAFQNFYDNKQGIQDELVTTWGRLAAQFAGDPDVAGYDLLNEPNPGLRLPGAGQIGAYYQRALTAIRAAESGVAGGFHHLAIVEPSALWSALGLDALPPVHDPELVFSPHLYNESITITDLISIENGFALAQTGAKLLGAALWTGEWGWFGSSATDAALVDRFTDAENAALTGGAWWSWKQACGDPHALRDRGATTGNLNPVSCPSGTPLPQSAGYAAALAKPYPRAAPGLRTVTATPFKVTGVATAGDPTLDLWLPGGSRPTLTTTGVTGLTFTQVSGGWRVTGQAAGAYSVQG